MAANQEELEFWLRKRGPHPFVTYRGGGMKAVVNIEIPLDEISARNGVEELQIGDRLYVKDKEVKNISK